MRIQKPFLIILLLLIPCLAGADIMVGGELSYTVVKGDTLELISAKLGAGEREIIKVNGLNPNKILPIGLKLKVNNRKIVPRSVENGIVVNIADRMLYSFKDGALLKAFPVGLGIAFKDEGVQWRTPEGKFTIVEKRKDPVWHVPKSIQEEMVAEGKPLKTTVPPGPENPLGRYSLDTSLSGILIHETIWPGTVYAYRSHGCVRVSPENMASFFQEVKVRTPGEFIYVPMKVALTSEGRVFLEVNRDAYRKVKDITVEVKRLIEERGLSAMVDWQKVGKVVKEKTGNAEDITL